MKVKVKDIGVHYDGERYEKGDSLEIKKEHFNDSIFEEEGEKKKSDKK